ncbi:MAG: hypothetical protein HOD92_04385 [Deltaproteobacteria bacterium]|jgi:cytidine deaminase|nr:hypothetical protein [Deltaproteobacteria bacterium]MBT4526955.1 hypothetical protein [Deltaproteobacteria bacterium]
MKRKIRIRDRDRSQDKVLDGYLTDSFIGVLIAEEIKALSGVLRLTVEEAIVQVLPRAVARSITSVRGKQAASGCRCSSGSIYFGCEIELQTDTETFSISAEQVALSHALSNGETDIRAFISSHPVSMPSLRTMNEWHTADHISVSYSGVPPQLIRQLLPNDYELNYQKPIKSLGMVPEKTFNHLDDIKEAASLAFYRSHGPYTDTRAGIAIEGPYQKMFCGSYIETTADHSGLNPLSLALGNMIIADQCFKDIKQVQLMVQKSNTEAIIQQTEAILKSVSNTVLNIDYLE